jgi:hypothetical protein
VAVVIRFQPDTWRDALLRPLAMAAPDSGVYMEVMAPDLRYVALLLLTAVVLVALVRRRTLPRPTALLLAFVWVAFIPWLVTSGNGRYFLPVLVVTGPLCVALVYRLPVTANFRVALAAMLVLVQGTAVLLNDPRHSWGLVPWGNQSYFEIELGQREREQAAAYVLISNISYSLIAPQFDHDARWIGLSSLSDRGAPDDVRAQSAIAAAQRDNLRLELLVPSLPKYMDAAGQPDAQVQAQINRMLAPHRLALASGACTLLRSRTIAQEALGDLRKATPDMLGKLGFWECPLKYPAPLAASAAPGVDTSQADRVFERLEQACPRWFHAGEAKSVRMIDGFMRTYPSSDMKAFVMDNGQVWYRYWRALDANAVGTRDQVLADGFKMDCNQVNGRSGLPWERTL